MKNLFLSIIALCGLVISPAQDSLLWTKNIYFASNISDLDAEQEAVLASLCDSLAEWKNYTITLIGHSDALGAAQYNYDLSKRRVWAVKSSMDLCADSKKFRYAYFGEDCPQESDPESKGKMLNRRVEIIVRYLPEKATQTVKTFEVKTLGVHPQLFQVNNQRDTLLISPKGVKYLIPAYALNTTLPLVEYEIKEVNQASEMILENLSTNNADYFLESAGMWQIRAKGGGKELFLSPNKAITVAFPSTQIDPEMQIWQASWSEENRSFWHLNAENHLWREGGESCKIRKETCDSEKITYLTKAEQAEIASLEDKNAAMKLRETYLYRSQFSRLNRLIEMQCLYAQSESQRKQAQRLQKIARMKKNLLLYPPLLQIEPYSDCGRCLALLEVESSVQLLDSAEKYGIEDNEKLISFLMKQQKQNILDKIAGAESLTETEMNYYLTRVVKIGDWVNLDKIIEIPKEESIPIKVILSADGTIDGEPYTYIYAERLNGNYRLSKETTIYTLANNAQITKNEPIWIVAIGQGGGMYYLGMEKTTASDKPFELKMYPVKDKKELEAKLEVLNIKP